MRNIDTKNNTLSRARFARRKILWKYLDNQLISWSNPYSFIQANVIKILSDMGFKPMQIYRHINALPNVCYSYRGILEVLKAWQDGNFVALKFYNKVEVSIDK